MNFQSPITRHVLFFIFGVLIAASLIGFILGKLAKSEVAKATVNNLNARTNSWWVMVIVLLGALMSGETGTFIIFGIISFLALREFLTATPTRSADHRSLFVAFFLVLPYQYWLVHTAWYGMFLILIPVYAFVLLPMLSVLCGDATEFLERSARIQWGLMVCVYFISHIPMILHLEFPPLPLGNAGLILFLVIIVQGSDVLQYVWGKLLGKHPIAPSLSPKKTWEGFSLGVLSASSLGAALHWLTPCSASQAFVVALLLCVLGFFGGLVMSAIKRARGIKDWGTLIEGHGGMMDRIDSLCFSGPLYFHVLHYFFGES
jgi:phosphatidate cytidylyltransferase